MAQHKAPTAVTVAPIQEKSGLALWISRHWIHLTIVVLAIGAAIVVRHQMEQSKLTGQATSWEKLSALMGRDEETGLLKSEPAALAAVATDLKDTVAGPSARLAEAQARIQRHDYDGALTALGALEREHPTHPYVVAQLQVGEQTMSLVASLKKSINDMQAFDAAHPGMYANPAPPADAPRVRLTTDQGEIVLALYKAQAPKHCENFLKLCNEKYYDGTKIHRAMPKYMILGGDPNSRAGEPATWGQGGPGYTLAPEPNELTHFPGSLGMYKSGSDNQSNGSQFYITTGDVHSIDGINTVFGTVISGLDVVRKIAASPPAPNSDRPLTPVVITSAVVIQP